MPSKRIPVELNNEAFFLTFTIKNWYYILDRYNRRDILLETFKYCQKEKGLLIYSFVLMINHIHLIARAPDVAGFIRDFKKHTSREIQKNIQINEPSLIKLFLKDDGSFNLWMKTNMPVLIQSKKFFEQKRRYIEMNPVRRGYVDEPCQWRHSSAHEPCLLNIENI